MPLFNGFLKSALLLENDGVGDSLLYKRCLGVFAKSLDTSLCCFGIFGSRLCGHARDNLFGFLFGPFNLFQVALGIFSKLGGIFGTAFRLGLDFAELSKAKNPLCIYFLGHFRIGVSELRDQLMVRRAKLELNVTPNVIPFLS